MQLLVRDVYKLLLLSLLLLLSVKSVMFFCRSRPPTIVDDQITKSGAQRQINTHVANVKWLFSMSADVDSEAVINVVAQVESFYGYRLVTLRSTVQVFLFFSAACQIYLFIYLYLHSFIHSLIFSFIHSFIH